MGRIIDNHTERSHYSNTFVKPTSSTKARSVSVSSGHCSKSGVTDFGKFLDEARITREYKQIFGTLFFRGGGKLFSLKTRTFARSMLMRTGGLRIGRTFL